MKPSHVRWEGDGSVDNPYRKVYSDRMTRNFDHDTSYAAADAVRKITGKIKLAVMEYATSRGNYGFTDSELKNSFPSAPESSYRKRRTELVREGRLVDSGQRRVNLHGRDEIVWRIK